MTITRILALLSVIALLASLPHRSVGALAATRRLSRPSRWSVRPPSTANLPWMEPWSSP